MSKFKVGEVYYATSQGITAPYTVIKIETTEEGTTISTEEGYCGIPVVFCSNPDKHHFGTRDLKSLKPS